MKYKLEQLSVFFPAFNEAGNIEEAVKQAVSVVPSVAKKYEIIVVNDGSQDATLQIARRLSRKYKYVKVVTQKNKGYGGALKLGFKTAKYDWIFYTDADLQFDFNELKKLVKKSHEAQMVIGYRKKRAEGWKRQFFAQSLKLWNRLFLAFPLYIKDIDCGFKLINRTALEEVKPLFSNGAMISTELLLKAHYAQIPIEQVGVNHYKRRTGHPTGTNFNVIFKAVYDTFLLQKLLVKKIGVKDLTLSRLTNLKKDSLNLAQTISTLVF